MAAALVHLLAWNNNINSKNKTPFTSFASSAVRPLDVKIVGSSRPLVAGQVHEFSCVSSGSRPPAKIIWLKDGHELGQQQRRQAASTTAATDGRQLSWTTSTTTSADGQQQHSKLALKLERSDRLAQLSCRAVNEKALALAQKKQAPYSLGSWQLEDSITLSVQCKYNNCAATNKSDP